MWSYLPNHLRREISTTRSRPSALTTPHTRLESAAGQGPKLPSFSSLSAHSTLRTSHSTLRTPHSTLRTSHSALRTPQVSVGLRCPSALLTCIALAGLTRIPQSSLGESVPYNCGTIIVIMSNKKLHGATPSVASLQANRINLVCPRWSATEDACLLRATGGALRVSTGQWDSVAVHVPNRTRNAAQARLTALRRKRPIRGSLWPAAASSVPVQEERQGGTFPMQGHRELLVKDLLMLSLELRLAQATGPSPQQLRSPLLLWQGAFISGWKLPRGGCVEHVRLVFQRKVRD